MNNRKKILIATGVLAVMLVILALDTLDYDLSRVIINKESHFGEFFNRFGDFPAILSIILGIAILYGSRKRSLGRNILSHVLSLPFMGLFTFLMIQMPVRYAYENHSTGMSEGIPAMAMNIIYIIAVIVFTALIFGANKMDKEQLRNWKKFALILILLPVAEIVLVNVVKIIWGRPRMRIMESFEQFKYWYEISFPAANNDMKSFPSGHTANGFTMIVYSLFFVTGSKSRNWFVAFALAWGSCVALSRILLGAHFLSDVIMGGYITVVLFYVLSAIFLKEKKTA